ncbi:hypothetical protein BD413DRAFT_616500 [Trametes elegans]|nr:hypothetical protein BD413DRAFT_616500 [Trametes elegans]
MVNPDGNPETFSQETEVHIPRPPNCFMIFRAEEGRKRRKNGEGKCVQSQWSKVCGKEWMSLAPEAKAPYVRKAEKLAAAHKAKFPNYKFQPKRKKAASDKKTPRRVKKPQFQNDRVAQRPPIDPHSQVPSSPLNGYPPFSYGPVSTQYPSPMPPATQFAQGPSRPLSGTGFVDVEGVFFKMDYMEATIPDDEFNQNPEAPGFPMGWNGQPFDVARMDPPVMQQYPTQHSLSAHTSQLGVPYTPPHAIRPQPAYSNPAVYHVPPTPWLQSVMPSLHMQPHQRTATQPRVAGWDATCAPLNAGFYNFSAVQAQHFAMRATTTHIPQQQRPSTHTPLSMRARTAMPPMPLAASPPDSPPSDLGFVWESAIAITDAAPRAVAGSTVDHYAAPAQSAATTSAASKAEVPYPQARSMSAPTLDISITPADMLARIDSQSSTAGEASSPASAATGDGYTGGEVPYVPEGLLAALGSLRDTVDPLATVPPCAIWPQDVSFESSEARSWFNLPEV